MDSARRAHCTFPSPNSLSPAWKDYDKLRKAVRCQNTDLVRSLIESGAHINQHCVNYSENTPLHLAVISQCSEIVKILLDNGADIDAKNALLDTPLTMAAKMKNTDMVDLLLSYCVQHCQNDRDGLSHLHIGCMRNNVGVVRKLVLTDHGKSIDQAVGMNSILWPGFTPLHFAAYYGCAETVEYLLKCGADIMIEDSKQFMPVHWADLHRDEKIIDLLLTASKNEFKKPSGSHGLTQFHIACTRDDPSVVEHFLKLGVSINLEVQSSQPGYWEGWKPIHFAMYYECPRVMKLLLNFKADCEINPIHRCPSLLLEHAFVTKNDTIYDNFIIGKGKCDNSNREIKGYPNIHLACINNDGDFVLEWLQRNRFCDSRLNEPIGCGFTPLHLAIKYDSIDAMKLLLAWDADFTVQDSQGKTPVHTAFEKGYFAYIYKIAEDFTDNTPNVTDNFGLSFLHILCTTDSPESVEIFLSKGNDVNAKVGNDSPLWAGFTPMDFACEFEWEENVEVLLKYKSDIFIKNKSIFDHFNLLFKENDRLILEGFEKLLFKNLMAAISSPFMQIGYSNPGISPLHALCANPLPKTKVLKRYLRTHANEINQGIEMPQSREFHKCTPLHLAMLYYDFKKAKILLKAGADPLLLNGAGMTPIECAYRLEPLYMSEAEAKCLFPCEMAVNSIQPMHFFIACCSYRIDFVKDTLEGIMDPILKDSLVNCRSILIQTPLHHLVVHESFESHQSDERRAMMQLLLENGADVDAEDYLLSTPLLLAGKETVTTFLIDHGADINAQNIHGKTCLHIICKNNDSLKKNINRLIMLLENGADINIEDQQGHTCLTLVKSLIENHGLLQRYVIPFLRHVKKLMILGFDISSKNEETYSEILESYGEIFNEGRFESKCQKELGIISQRNIDQYTTARDILFKSVSEMTHYCQNEVIQSLFGSINQDLPIYGPLINLQIKKGKIRQPLLQNSKKSLSFLCKKSLPHVCSEMILQHLSNRELRHFIKNVSIIEFASMTKNSNILL